MKKRKRHKPAADASPLLPPPSASGCLADSVVSNQRVGVIVVKDMQYTPIMQIKSKEHT